MKNEELDKWNYIRLISTLYSNSSYYLTNMMDEYNCNNLQEIKFEQAKEYYEILIEKKRNEELCSRNKWRQFLN